jgi:hypothetical protein
MFPRNPCNPLIALRSPRSGCGDRGTSEASPKASSSETTPRGRARVRTVHAAIGVSPFPLCGNRLCLRAYFRCIAAAIFIHFFLDIRNDSETSLATCDRDVRCLDSEQVSRSMCSGRISLNKILCGRATAALMGSAVFVLPRVLDATERGKS